jgi:nitrile hydratase
MHPAGHTRLPQYARGRRGVVERLHRPALLPDTNVGPVSRDWDPVYAVRFESRELWGEDGRTGDAVVLDVFERYLEAPGAEEVP